MIGAFTPKLFILTAVALLCIPAAFSQPGRVRTKPPDSINAVQFSPDGGTLAIAWGAEENRVDLWDAQSSELRRSIKGFDGPVWSVSFSPDGRTLATASGAVRYEKIAAKTKHRVYGNWSSNIQVWNWHTGELISRFELEDTISAVVSYSPDSQLLAVVENRLHSGLGRTDIAGPTTWQDALRTGVLLHSELFDSRLSLLDAYTGERKVRLKDDYNAIELPELSMNYWGYLFLRLRANRRLKPMIFSPDGALVATWKADKAALINIATGAEVLKLSDFKGRLVAIAFSPDGKLIAGAIENIKLKGSRAQFLNEIRVWDAATGSPGKVLRSQTHSASSLLFANNHQLLIGGLEFYRNASYASLELVDLEKGSQGKIVSNQPQGVSSMALSPNGESLAFQTYGENVKLLTVREWTVAHTFGPTSDTGVSASTLRRYMVSVSSVPAVAFLAQGKTIAGEIEQNGIKIWDARNGEIKRVLGEKAETGSIAAFSRDGSTVAEISPDQTVRTWSIESGGFRHLPGVNATAISLSDDGKLLAVAERGRIQILSTPQLETVRVISGLESLISLVVLSPDGKNLAAAIGSSVGIWSASDGKLRQTLASGGEISALQFGSPDQIAIGRKDGSLALWSISRGAIIFEAKKHSLGVSAICFSNDTSLMASGSDDLSALIWDTASGKVRNSLKGHELVITSLAFSPDNSLLAVGTGNASVVLWQVAKGKLDRVLR